MYKKSKLVCMTSFSTMTLKHILLLISLTDIYFASIDTDDDSLSTINDANAFEHVLNVELPETTINPFDDDEHNTSLQDEIAALSEPDFLLIGVVKSGSTSLYHYMVQHPQISGVESTYLLPENMRENIQNILKQRRAGKLPPPKRPKTKNPQLQTFNPLNSGPQKLSKPAQSAISVKDSIYEINNFDLARMIKPIIDQKEVRFFDSFWYNHLQTLSNHSLLTAWKWYLECFNQTRYDGADNMLRGEASPTYFASSQFTAERIKLWLPNVKLILLLRNPVRRFVSHLKMIKENHAANMRFRKERKMEQQKLSNGKNSTGIQKYMYHHRKMTNFCSAKVGDSRRILLDFQNYDMSFGKTRYGTKKFRKMKKNFFRTRGQTMFDPQRDSYFKNDRDEEAFADYINAEANEYERLRHTDFAGPPTPIPTRKPYQHARKKPVNKMEKIIGKIYKMSMYQVILVSNANPTSHRFYSQRWGIDRQVKSFVNRLLFGGIYTMRMKEWLKRFDSDHLFYRESSQLFDDPVGLMQDLESYLGVEPLGEEKWKNITAKVYNVQLLQKGKGYAHKEQDAEEIEHWDINKEIVTKIPHPSEDRKWESKEIIDMLREYYKTHNQQLSELFDRVKYKGWDY